MNPAFEAGARFTLPAARPGVSRHLYFFDGTSLTVAGERLAARQGVDILGSVDPPWTPLLHLLTAPNRGFIANSDPIDDNS